MVFTKRFVSMLLTSLLALLLALSVTPFALAEQSTTEVDLSPLDRFTGAKIPEVTTVTSFPGSWHTWKNWHFLGGTDTAIPQGIVVMIKDDSLYIGEVVDGLPHGMGARYDLVLGGRKYYCGGFDGGKVSGHGILYNAGGTRFEGEFFNGEFDGIYDCVHVGRARQAQYSNGQFESWIGGDSDAQPRWAMLRNAKNGKVLGEFYGDNHSGWCAYIRNDGIVCIGLYGTDGKWQEGSYVFGSLFPSKNMTDVLYDVFPPFEFGED